MLSIKPRSLPCRATSAPNPQSLLWPISFHFNPGVFVLSLLSPLRCHYIVSLLVQHYAILSDHFLSYYSCLIFVGNACQNLTSFESLFPEYSKVFIFYCLGSVRKSLLLSWGGHQFMLIVGLNGEGNWCCHCSVAGIVFIQGIALPVRDHCCWMVETLASCGFLLFVISKQAFLLCWKMGKNSFRLWIEF